MDLNLFINKLTATLHLGNQLSEVVRVSGGYMHRMYRLNTASGVYAVKLLNPKVMERPDAMGNYIEADRLESILQKNNIPIIPSLVFNGEKMQELDGQYLYIYEWFAGKTLKVKDITTLNCKKMGETLSGIHNIDMKNEKSLRRYLNIDWEQYIFQAKNQNIFISELLDANKDLLYHSQNSGNNAVYNIPSIMAICHNDMDSKNVLWLNEEFKIIDLECLGYANPYLELFELALCWSGYEECNIDLELFSTFINAYFGDRSKPSIDWEAIYYSNYGRIEWLEYNVKRALLIECSTIEEQKLGIEQVKETLKQLNYYNNIKDNILSCLSKIFEK